MLRRAEGRAGSQGTPRRRIRVLPVEVIAVVEAILVGLFGVRHVAEAVDLGEPVKRVVIADDQARRRRGRRRRVERPLQLVERPIGMPPRFAGRLVRLARQQAIGVILVDVLLVLDEAVARLGQVEGGAMGGDAVALGVERGRLPFWFLRTKKEGFTTNPLQCMKAVCRNHRSNRTGVIPRSKAIEMSHSPARLQLPLICRRDLRPSTQVDTLVASRR
jgi:hypothetical protein